MKVYIVSGKTGEYSDGSEWIVAAYTHEADAKTHVEKAEEYANAWLANSGVYYEPQSPYDEQFQCDYTGTTYWYSEIELREKFTAPETIQ